MRGLYGNRYAPASAPVTLIPKLAFSLRERYSALDMRLKPPQTQVCPVQASARPALEEAFAERVPRRRRPRGLSGRYFGVKIALFVSRQLQ
jgi:hypothetical protein